MCGVAGFCGSPPQREELLAKMLGELAHRGPEGTSTFHQGVVALGHARLAFTDLSASASQPFVSGQHALAFNGEIFNHESLGAARSIECRTTSDAEVLLHCLASDGLAALPELNGFFGIAYADLEAQRLWLIRDRFGVKPLYYTHTAGLFGFASEIRPLRWLIDFHPEPSATFHNLVGNWTQGPSTGIEGVHRVLPGGFVCYDLRTGALETGRWFSLAHLRDHVLREELQSAPIELIEERLQKILSDSISRRSSGEAPLGVLCSGGLDSGLVTSILHKYHPLMTAFTVRYTELPEWSEFEWAEKLTRHLGMALKPVDISAARWRSLFVPTAVAFEYPLWHESSISLAAIAYDLRHAGIKGVLGGDGADELFGGYDYKYHPQREAFAAWAGLPAAISTADPQEIVHDPMLDFLYGPYRPHASDRHYRSEITAMSLAATGPEPTPERDLEAVLSTELLLFLGIVLCRFDRSLMQFGIEGREPYLDQELVHFAFNLPLHLKTHPQTKAILRRVARTWLPDSFLKRKKRGFSVNPEIFFRGFLDKRFLENAHLRDYLKISRPKWLGSVGKLAGRSLLRAAGAEIWYRSIFLNEPSVEIEESVWLAASTRIPEEPVFKSLV